MRSLLTRSLRYFVAVAERGSIRAAADELHVAQSAVGRQLQALEYEVGVTLFERRSRGIVLTQPGRLLLDYALHSQQEAELLRVQLDAMQGLERGRVRIAAIESMVPRLLPEAINRFRSLHPGIDFHVTVTTTDDVVALVCAGDVELGIGFGPVPSPNTSVVYERAEPLLAVMSPANPLADGSSVTLAEALAGPIALPPPKSGARSVIDVALSKAGLRPTPILETNSIELLHRFAASGDGIALLLRHTVAESVRAGAVRALPLSDADIVGTVALLRASDQVLAPATLKVASILRDELDSFALTCAEHPDVA